MGTGDSKVDQGLMKEGLIVQAATRFLIRRLGYDIVKAEEEMLSPKQTSILARKVGLHLVCYSDYIVKMGRRIYVIEVKAKQRSPLLRHQRPKIAMINTSIFLKRNYVDTVARVLVLVVLYPMGLFGASRMPGEKVHYRLFSAEGPRTADGGIEITLDQNLDSYRWVKAATFKKWVKTTKAEAQVLLRMHPLRSE